MHRQDAYAAGAWQCKPGAAYTAARCTKPAPARSRPVARSLHAWVPRARRTLVSLLLPVRDRASRHRAWGRPSRPARRNCDGATCGEWPHAQAAP